MLLQHNMDSQNLGLITALVNKLLSVIPENYDHKPESLFDERNYIQHEKFINLSDQTTCMF